ncbi:hypothetical protein H0H87_001471, partial [Tephrocybe sp. NHM501043]
IGGTATYTDPCPDAFMSSESLGVALVTGASRGIGRAIALRLAHDGFDVAINDIPAARAGLETLKDEILQKGRKSCIAIGDVSLQSHVEDMVSTTVNDLGRLDVVSAVPRNY